MIVPAHLYFDDAAGEMGVLDNRSASIEDNLLLPDQPSVSRRRRPRQKSASGAFKFNA
jgi:hypothetical protein